MAYTTKYPKLMKTAQERKEQKRAARKKEASDPWKDLKVLKGLKSDVRLAIFYAALDIFYPARFAGGFYPDS